ncbi:MAG: GIY-YIG nuclease family protein [Patescibacteria group bacterium]|jgi:putative endonuclease|nr:GIY-YIG nuclease family protein [Patescibacteria group bacterium]
MYSVYLLRSLKDKNLYIGSTFDLKSRYTQHLEGKVISTKNRRPLELIYYEAYNDKLLAQERERKLKQFGSSYRGLIKRLNIK